MDTTNMRTVTVAFDAARLPLTALADVLSMLQDLSDMGNSHDGMVTVGEMTEVLEAPARQPKARTTANPDQSSEGSAPEQTEMDLMMAALSDGQKLVLEQMRAANKAMSRTELAESMPDKKGNVIGTWLHALETKGLIVSEKEGEETMYRATAPEMAEA